MAGTVEVQIGDIRQEAWDLLLSILVANREDMRYCLACGEPIQKQGSWWHITDYDETKWGLHYAITHNERGTR